VRSGRRFAPGDTATFHVSVPQELVAGSYKAGLGVAEHDTREIVASARPVHFFVHGRPDARGVADLHGRFDFGS